MSCDVGEATEGLENELQCIAGNRTRDLLNVLTTIPKYVRIFGFKGASTSNVIDDGRL